MRNTSSFKTIDIHGMTAESGRRLLQREIQKAPPNTDKIVVIHGSNNGTVLRDMVRNLRLGRIEQITPTFANDGETTIYLKKAPSPGSIYVKPKKTFR